MAFWTVGDVVKKLRERKGWTQEQLAEASGVNAGTIVTLEAAGDRTKQDTLQRVAGALGVTVSRIHAIAEAVPEGLTPDLLQAAARTNLSVQEKMVKVLKAPTRPLRKAHH